MTKRDIIDSIRRHNPTAGPDFLDRFAEDELLAYLHHLRDVESENRRHQNREYSPLPN